ncbi:ABC transporter ATP-binding protein [bacterium]|nr:MAG: ABC transporter ATP-binding protein [bacterium]
MNMIDQEIAISLQQAGKKFCRNLKRSLYYGFLDVTRIFAGISFDSERLRKDEFWAVSNLSLEVRKGESLGVIGANGSGKSTLLRLLSGIYTPDQGRVVTNGKVGSLITLGAGFHPHFTGRENIFFNGTLLGLSQKELEERYDDIVRFADLDEFIEAPVSTYSTGMRMRLGFAIAIHTKPDILLIDEILAVGDVNFIKNSYDRIENLVTEKGVSAIVVSHNVGMIQRLCQKTLVLDKGRMVFLGDTLEALSRYYELSLKHKLALEPGRSPDKFIHHPDCPMQIRIEDFSLCGTASEDSQEITAPGTVRFQTRVRNTLDQPAALPTVSILILDPGLIDLIASVQSHGPACEGVMIPAKGELVVECEASYFNLAPGEYRVIVKLGGPKEGLFCDSVLLTRSLKVSWSVDFLRKVSSVYRDCKLFIPTEWKVER